ncbi:Gfo/Idh/MocA family protein [Brachybacterium alimentarium]|uniref:Oxidoreductase n=1 Tax=Brachybacterium alimentarium TaxID=47845 RepID=A0A2A3YKK9_9MICO|nr:Gfo/Idh/MocA family oxidoreductase [Brachybacterium alimentarium]PCC35976.1 oxidoreductase [Brachybacterium alimentarium]PCC40292.1 oxidoreductase [Brachybacterium alimentarium]RCS81161.1 gfo/Idh/MocA family oxidoreductase [Brachybacterium alimentarium]
MTAAAQESTRRLRAGVIGLGWAGQQHVAAYAADPTVDLVAISAMEEHLLAEFGDRYQVEGRYPDWKQMLSEAEIDVVSIATPTFLHAPMAIAALEAGLHVITEKPMAENAEAAGRMVEAANTAGRVLDVSFNHRQRGDVRALKEVVDSGVLGKLYYAKTGWIRRQGIPGLGTWFTKSASAGGGAMMDIGIHMLDMALHLMDEPAVTAASASTHAEFGPLGRGGSGFGISAVEEGVPFEVEDLATAFLRLEGGGTLLLESSWAQWIAHDLCYVTLYGADGGATIEWGGPEEPRITVWTEVAGIPAELHPAAGEDGRHAAAVANFLQKVRSDDWAAHNGALALRRAEVIDACYASAKAGAEVTIGG